MKGYFEMALRMTACVAVVVVATMPVAAQAPYAPARIAGGQPDLLVEGQDLLAHARTEMEHGADAPEKLPRLAQGGGEREAAPTEQLAEPPLYANHLDDQLVQQVGRVARGRQPFFLIAKMIGKVSTVRWAQNTR